MLKILINEEEVVANQNFTINKHMLNTPSVILNNVCPKSWCENRNYSGFYHPLDYSKCKIKDVPTEEESVGQYTKITNSGTITAKGSMESEITQLDGLTTQSGTPTPSSPQPINVVSGRQEIEVCKKNLCPTSIDDWESGQYDTNGNKTTLSSRIRLKNLLRVEPNTKYYFNTYATDTNFRFIIRTYDNVGTFVSSYGAINNGTIFTTPNTVYYLGISMFNGNISSLTFNDYKNLFENGNIKPLICLNSETDKSYEEYKGQTYEINLGKNLLNINESSGTTNGVNYSSGNGIITLNNTATANSFIAAFNSYMWLEAGTYTLSLNNRATISNTSTYMRLMDRTNTAVIGTSVNFTTINNKGTFTLSTSGKYRFQIRINSGVSLNNFTIKPQLEKGSEETSSYSPYKTPIELCKIGDYQDFIKKGTGKNLVNFSNSVSWRYSSGIPLNTTTPSMITSQTSNSYSITYTSNSFLGVLSSTMYLKPNTQYTISFNRTRNTNFAQRLHIYNISANNEYSLNEAVNGNVYGTPYTKTFTTGETGITTFMISTNNSSPSGQSETITNIQLEEGTQASSFEPYGMYNKWYIEKNIGKGLVKPTSASSIEENGLRTDITLTKPYQAYPVLFSNYFTRASSYDEAVNRLGGNENKIGLNTNGVVLCNISGYTKTQYIDFFTDNDVYVYYPLATPTYTEITDSELIGQLNAPRLFEGLNNVSVSSADLSVPTTFHYNYYFDRLLFCGVVKNSGKISLNPREPHYTTLQILDFKDFLSTGETLDYVIYQKTILEAIQQVISSISDYGFILGNVNILNYNDIIGAYSTKDKTAYDVFNYIADITQSRWTTRMIDENTVAIDFYDPTLMPQGSQIDYTEEFFKTNLIDDMKYNYGTNNYRNKQVMTSNQVVGNLTQTQKLYSDGYQNQYIVDLPIAKISNISVNGVQKKFATEIEKSLGINADFYYSVNSNILESEDIYTVNSEIEINYIPVIEGRQVITNNDEITRIHNSTGRKGIVSRYETRNDATTLEELQKIGQSYIKYKGTPEIVLTIQSRMNLWEVGQRVEFNAPIDELETEYMVRTKKINYIASVDTLFYTYELVSSFNSETEINYFDNQRAKAKGNIADGEYISRNVDIENSANIIFYETTSTEITMVGNNILNSTLNSPFTS